MADSKTMKEMAADITVAWIKAKTDITVAGVSSTNDRGLPTAEQVSEFYKTTYDSIANPNK